MKIVNRSQMQNIDKLATEVYQIPSIILMENAGIQFSQKLLELIKRIPHRPLFIAYLIGPGNNGGDGLVSARFMHHHDINLNVFLFDSINQQAKSNRNIQLQILQHSDLEYHTILSLSKWQSYKSSILNADIIVDALFGTGLSQEVHAPLNAIIQDINQTIISYTHQHKKKPLLIALDVPSGLLSEENKQNQTILKVDRTISIGLPKLGFMDYPGKHYAGIVEIIPIGFPKPLLNSDTLKKIWITKKEVQSRWSKRQPNTHKGDYGHCLIIAGSHSYPGAALLSCKAALKSGVGLISIACPQMLLSIISLQHPEVIHVALDKDKLGLINMNSCLKHLEDNLNRYQSILIGPGITRHKSWIQVIIFLIENYPGRLIIDADALFLLSQYLKEHSIKHSAVKLVLTPHMQEMSYLIDKPITFIQQHKIQCMQSLRKIINGTVILKSTITLIATPKDHLYYYTQENAGMAKGGSGDVLAGLLTGLLAKKQSDIENQIVSAIFLHGSAGNLAHKQLGQECMIASNLIDYIPNAIGQLLSDSF